MFCTKNMLSWRKVTQVLHLFSGHEKQMRRRRGYCFARYKWMQCYRLLQPVYAYNMSYKTWNSHLCNKTCFGNKKTCFRCMCTTCLIKHRIFRIHNKTCFAPKTRYPHIPQHELWKHEVFQCCNNTLFPHEKTCYSRVINMLHKPLLFQPFSSLPYTVINLFYYTGSNSCNPLNMWYKSMKIFICITKHVFMP